jgi:hypothetical protein
MVVEERNTYTACIEKRYTAANTRTECGGWDRRWDPGDRNGDGRQQQRQRRWRQCRVQQSEDTESSEYQGQAGGGGQGQG